jgi:hypothetical protein
MVICLQIPTTFWIGGRTTSASYWTYRVSDIKQIEIHTAEPLVPDPSPFEVEIVTARLKRYETRGNDEISAELIQAGGEILWSEIHKLINSVCNKEELPYQWKEPIIVSIYKKDNKTDCAWGYNWDTLFLGDINTGTRPSRLGESRIWDSKIWSRVPRESDLRMFVLMRASNNCKLEAHPLVRGNVNASIQLKIKNAGRVSQGACRQDEVMSGKPPVVK